MRPLTHFVLWSLGLKAAETQTSEAERACLAKYASNRKRLVEIGTWHGVTTARLCGAMAADGVCYAVDPYYPGRLGFSIQQVIAHRELRAVGRGRVVWLRTTGELAAREQLQNGRGPVDFVFIDGDHSYEGLRSDWLGWKDQVAPDGIVCLHDSRSTPSRPIDDAGSVVYTREVIARDPNFKVVEEVDSLTVLRRRVAN